MIEERPLFDIDERNECRRLIKELWEDLKEHLWDSDERNVELLMRKAIESGRMQRDIFGLNPIVTGLQTALIVEHEIGVSREAVIGIIIHRCNDCIEIDSQTIESFGSDVAKIVHGLKRIDKLYARNPVVQNDNFRNLLVSFAEDMRVILIMIADRVNLMREIRDCDNDKARRQAASEAAYLYAPLAHKLGLYKLKSELEDLSLKYLEHDVYYMIKEKLNATKKARDLYIENFIKPVEARLREAGLHFHMKGRTKSIHSIWQKMQKQHCGFEGIYDLFAIRVILESPEGDTHDKRFIEKEKMLCWQTFSIVTDMYQPNPKRMRDWISVPKSNGYECLHCTVLGPERKWVEVQIRTERMDDIAEHGLAAHWRYKGVKSGENAVDEWLANIRNALETGDDMALMDQFKMDFSEDEVYVFTPKGDIMKFPKGATILDFAYYIHSGIGNRCTGARVNGRAVSIRHELQSGDEVEILTTNSQTPRRSWLQIVRTSRAKAKIRLALKELETKVGGFAKEMIERRFRNRKIDLEESVLAKAVKRLGFKETSEFYQRIADQTLDVNTVIEKYLEVRDGADNGNAPTHSADEYNFSPEDSSGHGNSDEDVLVIDNHLRGVDYHLAACCHPVYGDDIFGFVTAGGGIKIHRRDCPNAPQMFKRFGYRVVKARWSGKNQTQYSVALRIVGNDDVGIVNNITSIISKEEKMSMRSISIDSHDGLFSGFITVMLADKSRLEQIVRKLKQVKGVKTVERI